MFLKLLEEYFFLNLNYYFKGVDFQINIFLLSLAFGMSAAAILVTVYKRNQMNIVRQLIRHGANSEESAKTLSELCITPGFIVRSSLSKRGQLSSVIAMVGGFPFEKKSEGRREEKIDFSTARFYIKNPDRAAKINEENIPSYLGTAIISIIVILITVIVTLFMPYILSFITGF